MNNEKDHTVRMWIEITNKKTNFSKSRYRAEDIAKFLGVSTLIIKYALLNRQLPEDADDGLKRDYKILEDWDVDFVEPHFSPHR